MLIRITIGKLWRYNAKLSHTHNRRNIVWFHLDEFPTVVKFLETEVRDWGRGTGELILNKYEISAWEDEKVLDMDGGYGCTTMWITYCHWNIHLTMVQMVNSMLCTFSKIKRKIRKKGSPSDWKYTIHSGQGPMKIVSGRTRSSLWLPLLGTLYKVGPTLSCSTSHCIH